MIGFITLGRTLGWCWCWPKGKLRKEYDLELFLSKRLPIFWVMGPPGCGKTTIALLLAECSHFSLISIGQLIKDEMFKGKERSKFIEGKISKEGVCPIDVLINLLKEKLFETYQDSTGYILDGFPLNLEQARLFQFEICKVHIIIYPTLSLDALMVRIGTTKYAKEEFEHIKRVFLERSRLCQEVYRNYEQKTLKFATVTPPDILLDKLILDLNCYFGYKFNTPSNIKVTQREN